MGPREELNVAFLAVKLSQLFFFGCLNPDSLVVVEVETGYGGGRRQGHRIESTDIIGVFGNEQSVSRIVGPVNKFPRRPLRG
jgi:hypothetical protein